ncbi:hypothetical protein BOX15_Mlig026142g2 [Macrostomum lignano]|uniref:Charged multivesicular body protein 4b n=2 Tax=Macrostomum lignano TaxID=282301 RepID=A0A267DCT8_9PLAT|nr:hypothetical protein BOX15_Mlig026142g4 [Macrostomum lignano]PAA57964.1 hypothetical protein BOX15_Mlig026142g2 [Macrostomum lignano]
MRRLFGAKPKTQTPTDCIARLRSTEELLQKKIAHLEKKIEQETETAKRLASTNKKGALQALTRKKRYEKQIQQLDGTLSTLEFQREALENASMNREVVSSMKTASEAMKTANKGVGVDDINKLMDDIQEQREIAEELTNAISAPSSGSSELDDDELMAELQQLEQQDKVPQAAEPSLQLPEPVRDPLPADGAKKKKKQKDDEDLEKLQAWLA